MDKWKAEMERVREKRRRVEERRAGEGRSEKRKSQKKKDAGARKGKKVAKHCVFFQWFVAPEGRKVGSLKQRVRSHLARWEMKKCTPLWREAHLQVKKQKTSHVRSTFESCDVEKVHAIMERSTFRSQNAQSTPCTDHFWTFRSRFAWQAQGIVHLVKCEQDVRVFVAFLKTMAGVGHLKRICKDAFSVAGAAMPTPDS